MSDFKELATSYVLEDDELRMRELAAAAAVGIQNAPRKSSAVLIWAQSINQWMPSRTSSDDASQIEEGEDFGNDGDVIIRAKALGFLAATLEMLSKDVLKAEQIEHLIAFFGAMFAIDHKAGIMAAAKALRHLSAMRNFKPHMGAIILGHIVQLKDDFRLQAPATRLEIYELVERLLGDEAVQLNLEQTQGPSSGFMIDLLQLCRNERDPRNLLVWFGILKLFLGRYSMSSEVADEVFHVFSDYFPISMRSSATPAGITVDDLKSALRMCFSASHIIAKSVFDFLIQKLDQGDAITVTVKVDILRTIHACVENFPRPELNLVPYASRIWNSLKYEVRNGEVQETIDWTLTVTRSIAARLSSSSSQPERLDPTFLENFVRLALDDCIGDLSNPIYTKQAGLLLTSILGGSVSSFSVAVTRVLEAVKQGLRQAKSPSNVRDLISLLNGILRVRYDLAEQSPAGGRDVGGLVGFHSHDVAIRELLDSVYLRVWSESSVGQSASGDEISILKEILKGLAELIRQPGPSEGQEATLLCTPDQCSNIFQILSPHIVHPFQSSSAVAPDLFQELAPQATLALQSATVAYPGGFAYLVQAAAIAIKASHRKSEEASRSGLGSLTWPDPSPDDLLMLGETLSRLTFIGCSTIPTKVTPLSHFVGLAGELLQVLGILLDEKVSFRTSAVVLSGVYSAMLNFRDACAQNEYISTTGDAEDPIPATWEGDFRTQYNFPAIDNRGRRDSSGAWTPNYDTTRNLSGSQVFREYLKASLSIVSQLYRRATLGTSRSDGVAGQELSEDFAVDGSSGVANESRKEVGHNTEEALAAIADGQDRYLHQLAVMATFVVRDLNDAEQKNTGLHKVALSLFQTGSVGQSIFRSSAQNSRLDVLSMGILRGLRSGAVTSMVDFGVGLLSLLEDFEEIESLPDRTRYVRDCIATIVSNKYLASPGGLGSTVDFIKNKTSGDQASALTPIHFSRLVAIVAGGVSRLDKDAKELAVLLSLTPANHPSGGEQMARSLGLLVSSKEYLAPENHAVIKPIYRQWVYARLVKTVVPSAFPFNQDTPRSTINTISILSILRYTPFAVYEDDLDTLVRILIGAVVALPSWADIEVSLRILIEVVDAKATILADHLKALIDSAVKVLTTASSRKSKNAGVGLDSKSASRAPDRGSPKGCRKQALILLSRLPSKYEERHLVSYTPLLNRVLAAACGDRVREIREVAQIARENWSNVR